MSIAIPTWLLWILGVAAGVVLLFLAYLGARLLKLEVWR